MVGSLPGKVAIVTGGAQGIGRSVVVKMAAAGAWVVVADYNGVGAAKVAEVLAPGANVMPIKVDMTSTSDVELLVQRVMSHWGRIDIVVNNASNVTQLGERDGDVITTDFDAWDEAYACNLRGPAALCKFAIPHMIAGGGGAIINVASVNGMFSDIIHVAYGATKAGLITLSKYIASSFGNQGIRCNSVSPGLVMSPAVETTHPAFIDIVMKQIVGGKAAEPDDLAEVICFLASDASRYISGTNIVADGCLTAQLPFSADLKELLLS